MRLLGVDGCPAGWVVAESRLSDAGTVPLAVPSYRIVPTFGELLASLAEGRAVVALDIPIGLPSGQPRDGGSRQADRAARTFLGGRRGVSVFSAPCRPTLDVSTYAAACDAEMAACGKKLSRQAFGILSKVREVDRSISLTHQLPLDQSDGVIVREVHPEVAFALLRGGGAPGCGLVSSKRTPDGEAERLALLQPFVPDIALSAIRTDLRADSGPGRVVGRDDIVDALACLIVAYRIATGQARTFPSGTPDRDVRGLRMEIIG